MQDQELFAIVDKAWDEAWDTIHLEDGWKEEKKSDENGDVVFSRKNKKGNFFANMDWCFISFAFFDDGHS